jgi:hypothetical protein
MVKIPQHGFDLLLSRLQQRLHHPLSGHRQVAEASTQCLRDGVADRGDSRAASAPLRGYIPMILAASDEKSATKSASE